MSNFGFRQLGVHIAMNKSYITVITNHHCHHLHLWVNSFKSQHYTCQFKKLHINRKGWFQQKKLRTRGLAEKVAQEKNQNCTYERSLFCEQTSASVVVFLILYPNPAVFQKNSLTLYVCNFALHCHIEIGWYMTIEGSLFFFSLSMAWLNRFLPVNSQAPAAM